MKNLNLLGKPQIVEKTENGVTITWTRSNKVGASSLLGYIVEMFGKNSTDGWMMLDNKIQNTTFTQIGLNAGTSYFFVVRAENSHGVSSPSPLSESVIVGMVSFFFLFQFVFYQNLIHFFFYYYFRMI